MTPTAPPDTIPGVLERAARDAPGRVALARPDGTGAIDYAGLLAAATRVAGGLVAAGVGPGDRVALWGPNSVAWAVAEFGILFAAATVVPVNARYTAGEALDIIQRSSCRIVLADPTLVEDDVRAALASNAVAVAAIGDGDDSLPSLIGGGDGAAAATRCRSYLDARSISHIQWTSGTTGRPKGAMLRHGAMVATTADWVGIVGLGTDDRYPVIAPFSHIGGHKTGLLATVTARATAYPFPALDIDQLSRTIEDRAATILQGPPTMFLALVEEARRDPARFASLRVAVTGAATIPPPLVRAIREVIGVEAVLTAYGLTETTGVCTMTRAGDGLDVVCTTSGRPIASVGVRIAGDDGDTGEILVAGPNLMAGYLDDDEATAATITDGWLHTGDVGRLDAAGNLQIVDRIKDMVVVGGLNVYPAEVERVLLQHPGVLDAAVVGVADGRLGEIPAAFVRLAAGDISRDGDVSPDGAISPAGARPDPDALVAFCRQRLAGFKAPRLIWVVDAIPLNPAGKVDKGELRRRAARLRAG